MKKAPAKNTRQAAALATERDRQRRQDRAGRQEKGRDTPKTKKQEKTEKRPKKAKNVLPLTYAARPNERDKMNTYTQPTAAVREYQRLQQLVNRRCNENKDLETKKFWVNVGYEKAAEIAQANNLTIFDLVAAWETWTETIEKEREEIRKAGN